MSTEFAQLREQLFQVGGVSLPGPEGKTLYLVLNRNLGVERNGILVAYEGSGVAFVTLDQPLNQFRLVSAGFSLRIASALVTMINGILNPGEASTDSPVNRLSLSKD